MGMAVLRSALAIFLVDILVLSGCDGSTAPYAPEIMSYGTVPCLRDFWDGLPPKVINSQAEYDSLNTAPRICGSPSIDFATQTLLYQEAGGGGCSPPFLEVTLLKDVYRKEITFKLRVVRNGACDMAILLGQWVLIPKLPEGYTVIFQREDVDDFSAT